MRVQCPQCATGGNIPDEKIPDGGRKIVCPKCKASFLVQKESSTLQQAAGQDAIGYYQEGIHLLKGQQVDAAIEKFNAAIQVNPQYGEAYRYLGLAYGQKNLWEDATLVLQKAITLKSDDLLSLKNLGVAYLRQKQFIEAEEVLQQALQYAPDDQKIQSYLTMAARGKKLKSGTSRIESTSRPSQQDPSKSPASIPENNKTPQRNPVKELLDKGVVFLDNAQYNKAIETFQEVIRLTPKKSDGYVGLGMVYETRQNWHEAMKVYEKALEVNPDDRVAKENLRFAKKQKKKFRFKFWK